MNVFRSAPLHIKLLLVVLPLNFCLKLLGLVIVIPAIFASTKPMGGFVLALTLDVAVLVLAATASWGAWHPRPLFRWLVALCLIHMAGLNIYGALYPSTPIIDLPRIEVKDRDIESGVSFILSMLALWWVYACIFGRQAADFFKGASGVRSANAQPNGA